jgi:hypothetical protein
VAERPGNPAGGVFAESKGRFAHAVLRKGASASRVSKRTIMQAYLSMLGAAAISSIGAKKLR